ncbi:MAG: lysophospholipid acyltransferase family protein [Proteobacteria bacterium]|nr:lysophospholipid acyltransferase family protein [Pseudomonadota bacterium]
MERELPAWLRVLGTGLSFSIFGLLCLLGVTVLFPAARLWGGREGGDLRVQRVIHHCFRFFMKTVEVLGVLRIRVEGAEALRGPGPRIVVANHPSLADVLLLVSQLPQADCIVKRSAWSNPFLAGVVRAAGYLPNDEGEALLEACATRLRQGRTVLLFPEGTRSPAGGVGRFRRGAAHLALRTGVPLQPVTITCEPRMLMRGVPWYRVPERAGRFVLRVEEPVSALESDGAERALAARRLTARLREGFQKRLVYTQT